MSQPQAFRKKKAFLSWIKATTPEIRHAYRYGRLLGPELLLGTTPVIHPPDAEWDTRGHPIQLPDPENADQWWEELFDSDIGDYWVSQSGMQPLLVVCAKGAVWKPRDTIYALLHPDDFRLIYHDEFVSLVGKETARQMAMEVHDIGFSVRSLFGPSEESPSQPRRVPKRVKKAGKARKR